MSIINDNHINTAESMNDHEKVHNEPLNISVNGLLTNGDVSSAHCDAIENDEKRNASSLSMPSKLERNNGDESSRDEESDNGYCDDADDDDTKKKTIVNDDETVETQSNELPTFRPPKYVLPIRESPQSLQTLPNTVTVLDGPYGSKVYLIGTAHFSEESQQDVEQTIKRTQPNIVVLELCESRLSILSLDEKTIMDESKTMGMAKVKRNIQEYGLIQGIMYMLLLSLSAHLTKELGMAPGGEFRRAFHEANKVPGCVVHLGDRPVHVTLRRAISALTVWQKIKLAFGIIFNNESISREEVERCKQRDLLEEMLAEMTGEFPALSTVFVHERDIYLAYSLWLAASPIPQFAAPTGYVPSVVVGVVGIGHVPGIVRHWGKVKSEDIPPLLKLPEPSITSKIIRKTIRYSVLGLISWGAYRLLMPNSIQNTITEASISAIGWIQQSLTKETHQ